MRGRIAAACAAVLVGLAPASALTCAPWLGADAWVVAPASSVRQARGFAASLPALHEGTVLAPPAFPSVKGEPVSLAAVVEAPEIWRSPSGPAPSTAPPAV
jgi:hypothetical protein